MRARREGASAFSALASDASESVSEAVSESISEAMESESASVVEERGVRFDTAGAFYRRGSIYGRDLAMLTLAMRAEEGKATRGGEAGEGAPEPADVRVLDALAASGGRAARYLRHGSAAFVCANDGSAEACALARRNLEAAAPGGEGQRWRVAEGDGAAACHAARARGEFFDLVDVDSFGSEGRFVGAALECVRRDGGLVYITGTDGLAVGGHKPMRAWAAWGAALRPVPSANEHGLRALIAHAVREAAARGLGATPLFSLYAPHGPVWRVMLRVEKSASMSDADVGFASHCPSCGQAGETRFENLAAGFENKCRNCGATGGVLSGPMWLGPLHDPAHLREMHRRAAVRGWASAEGNAEQRGLARLLEAMEGEAAAGVARLANAYRVTSLLKGRGLQRTPGVTALVDALRDAGHAACGSHLSPEAIKTDADVNQIVELARRLTEPDEEQGR